jgi:predicted TPR repeat methyltransferase
MTESMREAMSLDGDVEKLAAFYARWASYYDDDVSSHGYGLPAMMVETVLTAARVDDTTSRFDDRSLKVLDAGCGTGLVGVALRSVGYTELHGIDLSPEMIERARELGIYRSLEAGVDLADPVPDHLLATADIVVVGGVFTVGHIPPEALEVVATLARPGGLLVVSTRASYHADPGFSDVRRGLAGDGLLELLVHIAEAPYTMDSTGDYWAWRVVGA